MEWSSILEWAFQRHLNPMSWYIRPIFLVALAYFCYRRSWKGAIITFLLMTSSMVWFPVPERINPEMQAVLDYELMPFVQPGFSRGHARFHDGFSRVDWHGILEALLRVGACGIECDADRKGRAVSDADGGKRLGAPRKYRLWIDSRQRHRAAADRMAEEAGKSRPVACGFPYRQAGVL